MTARHRLASAFGTVLRPIQRFLELEAASGAVLFAAAVVALAWANSPFAASYEALFSRHLFFGLDHPVEVSFRDVINDGLMALFFWVVGMEIKRELVEGELGTPARALLPAVAALGGMAVPAALYFAFNRSGAGARGWGIPVATDIAFSLGCLALLKGRIPAGLAVFLTALAIFDDIGGILVIALFYGHPPDAAWLGGAALAGATLVALNRLGARSGAAYAAVGAALWYALGKGGIHPTLAGVVLGLLAPARAEREPREVLADLHDHVGRLLQKPPDEALERAELAMIDEKLEMLEAPLDRWVDLLHRPVAFGVMPLFALANSGVSFAGFRASQEGLAVLLGCALGLFVGKQVGIFGATSAAVKLGGAPMPGGARPVQLFGISVLGGIGFTVSLFIAGLAFADHPMLLDGAKVGILLGSAASGTAGTALLWLSSKRVAAD